MRLRTHTHMYGNIKAINCTEIVLALAPIGHMTFKQSRINDSDTS